jgi:hypothetical protein
VVMLDRSYCLIEGVRPRPGGRTIPRLELTEDGCQTCGVVTHRSVGRGRCQHES